MSGKDDIADPELIARLAAWFGTGETIAATPAFTPPPEADPRLEELEAALDPLLVDRLEQKAGRADALLAFAADPLTSRVDLSLAKLEVPPPVAPHEEPEYAQPDDIRRALADHNTPQAVLRDLFRPVMYFGDIALRPIETGLETLAVDPTAEVRAAVGERVAPELGPLPAEMVATDLAELREIMARPWAESKPETTSVPSVVPDFEHYLWFGVEGGYDPDV